MTSKAQREGMATLMAAPALAMRFTGRMAPENSTPGKHNIGRASVAWATLPTMAEVSRPRPRAATAHSSRPKPIEAYVDSGRLGRRSSRRSTPSHLRRRRFPGGCFFAGAALEMGTRPGPVKEEVAAFQGGLTALIRQFVVTALEQHELPADEDPDALTFEMNGIILAANTSFVLRDDPAALEMASSVVRRRLGIATTGKPPPSTRRRVAGSAP